MPECSDLVVIGGGCYGTYHASQLLRAWQRGRLACARIIIVDRNQRPRARRELGDAPPLHHATADALAFLRAYLQDTPEVRAAQLVPAPYQPHLARDWLLGEVERACPALPLALEPTPLGFGLPFEHQGADANAFLSEAAWGCPATCIEPARCPATRGPRHWDLGMRLRERAEERGLSAVELFTCRHYAFGVGTIPCADLLAARERLLALATGPLPARVLIGTVSHCHGIVSTLRLG